MKRAFLTFALWAIASLAAAQPSLRMTDTEIGPIRAGMPIAELRALEHSFSTRQVSSEGIDYTEYVIRLDGGAEIHLLDIDGRVGELETWSPHFVTDRGARVGATLAELQALYPQGRMHIGRETHVGRYFSFATREGEPGGHFYFDADRLSDACFELREDCPTLGAERSGSYRAIYQDPMTTLRPRAIGPVVLGMTEAEIVALGFPITRAPDHLVVSVAADRDVEVTFRAGRAWRLTTTSSGFHAYRGGHVGASLDTLRAWYPEGREVEGRGSFLSFYVAPGHAFLFNAHPAFGEANSIRYTVTDQP